VGGVSLKGFQKQWRENPITKKGGGAVEIFRNQGKKRGLKGIPLLAEVNKIGGTGKTSEGPISEKRKGTSNMKLVRELF